MASTGGVSPRSATRRARLGSIAAGGAGCARGTTESCSGRWRPGRTTPSPTSRASASATARSSGATGRLVTGTGPVRTGVTAIVPHDGDPFTEPLFAGCHRLNGNGELTGLEWIRESGFLTSPIAITNTHSVGVVRDAMIAHAVRSHPEGTRVLVAPRRRRDVRRRPLRHERLPRDGRSTSTRRSPSARGARFRKGPSAAGPG